MNQEQAAYLSLGVSNLPYAQLKKLLTYLDEPIHLFDLTEKEIQSLSFLQDRAKEVLIKNKEWDRLIKYVEKIEKEEIQWVAKCDSNYPENLRTIEDAPLVLFYKGTLKEIDAGSIAVVGSRKCSDYGKWACRYFVSELIKLGIPIVSGLAIGIDKIAHETAVQKHGRTIGVLGNGVDIIYPKSNHSLFLEIPTNGAIISEFPLKTPPLPYHFPRRNRIISGISLATIVIEAAEKSGSLITASQAMDQGRDVFVLPGNINAPFSRGSNRLIRDGARILLEVEDILDEVRAFRGIIEQERQRQKASIPMSKDEEDILASLQVNPMTADEIAVNVKKSVSEVNALITMLEMKGVLVSFDRRWQLAE